MRQQNTASLSASSGASKTGGCLFFLKKKAFRVACGKKKRNADNALCWTNGRLTTRLWFSFAAPRMSFARDRISIRQDTVRDPNGASRKRQMTKGRKKVEGRKGCRKKKGKKRKKNRQKREDGERSEPANAPRAHVVKGRQDGHAVVGPGQQEAQFGCLVLGVDHGRGVDERRPRVGIAT